MRRSAEQDKDNRVTAKEPKDKVMRLETGSEIAKGRISVHGLVHVHLADETVLVHALALGTLGLLGPHLLDILENHIAVSVESLDTGQQLAVVSAGNEDLCAGADSGLQDGKRTSRELVFLDLGMPGMVTPEQMVILEKARGVEFERTFLTYMIAHHQGAIEMAQPVLGGALDPRAEEMATDVSSKQAIEIERMQEMLDARS